MESSKRGLCRCGQRATSELSYAEEMDQRQDASSPSPPSSPPTDGSYQTPVTELVTRLVPVPEDVQLPSPTSSEEEPIPIPPPRASTPGREVVNVAGLDASLIRLQVQEQAEDSSGAPPDYEGRIRLDPTLLDVERLVAALEIGVFKLSNTRVHQNLLLHHIGRSMA